MDSIIIRPFERSDREQVTALVNAHARAVIPGVTVSVNAVLGQLEPDRAEFIVDPWVEQRALLVAELRKRVIGAAQVQMYSSAPSVGEHYRGTGEIRWLIFWPLGPSDPPNPHWPDPSPAGRELLTACCAQLTNWGASRVDADGALPVPGVYGVPAQWPHVREAYEQGGFQHEGTIETLHMAPLSDLASLDTPAPAGMSLMRSVGINGTRLAAHENSEVAGYIEVELLDDPRRSPDHVLWADIGNLEVVDSYRGRGIDQWLIVEAAKWLRLSGATHLLTYAWPEEEEWIGLLTQLGFSELTRTQRGWTRVTNG
jgi:GNAT superfamily N-acetyltransferase